MARPKAIQVLAASIEATSGTAESLDATDAVFNAFDVEIQPEVEMHERPQQAGFSMLPSSVGAISGTCSFKLEVVGDGLAGIPAWASVFLPACGLVATAQVYAPTSEAPGTNVKTLTIGVYQSGNLKMISGAAGNVKLVAETGMPAVLEFTFTGVWVAPTTVAILAPNYPAIMPLVTKGATFTLAAWAPCWASLAIDLQNEIVLRKCATKAAGYAAALIVNRKPMATLDPEAPLIATVDSYALWLAGTQEALSFALTDGTDTITFAAPKAQRINVQQGDRDQILTDELELQLNASADAGDDEFTLTFA